MTRFASAADSVAEATATMRAVAVDRLASHLDIPPGLLADAREHYRGNPLQRQEIVADAGFAQPDEPIYTISNDAPF
jgi:hypothetical protein